MRCVFKSSYLPAGFVFAFLVSAAAAAQQPFWTQGSASRASTAPRVRLTDDGYVASAGAPAGTGFSAGSTRSTAPEVVALGFLTAQSRWFFDGSPGVGFKVNQVRAEAGRSYIKLTQTYSGLPVFGSGTVVQVRGNAIEYVSADVMREFWPLTSGDLETAPTITGGEAAAFADAWALDEFGVSAAAATTPELSIYDPAVVGNEGEVRLVWRFEVANPSALVREVVLVDAHDGKVAMHYSLIHDAMDRHIRDANNTDSVGAVARVEGQGPTGNTNVDQVYQYLGDTYSFYLTEHGRDSFDGSGGTMLATVRYCLFGYPCPLENAFWDGTRLWFGQGYMVDDVTAHELTHGVTTNESGLIYSNQSGAINESLSDMWGEWVDLTNGAGTDTAGVRWLVGEDLPGGALRSMSNPTSFGDPDRLGSPFYYNGSADNGGVHVNSGVGNKLAYLLTDGGSFNGYTVTGLGITLVADLMYECQVNLLTPSSNYYDLYDAIAQAAINLGFSPGQQAEVDNAGRAVEIRFIEGVHGFNASTQAGVPEIELNWLNPNAGSFTEVRVRRSTTSFPSNPDSSGTLIYQGPGTTFTDTAVTVGTLYYYSIWAYHGPTDRSSPSMASSEAGVLASTPAERFTNALGDEFDLDGLRISFWPEGPTAYLVRRVEMSAFRTNPVGGTQIFLGDDDFRQINLSGGRQVSVYGTAFNSFYVNSNGRITFGGGDTEYQETFSDHFALPGISALFDDLNPASSGTVSYKEMEDRVAITFEDVPEFGSSTQNSFQIELHYNGLVRVTYLGIGAKDGIVGVSAGGGTPPGFVETDLSGSLVVPAPVRPWTWITIVLLISLCAIPRLRSRSD